MEPDDEDPNKISLITDEEAELFRRLRFGQLPEPVSPADMIASVDTRWLQTRRRGRRRNAATGATAAERRRYGRLSGFPSP